MERRNDSRYCSEPRVDRVRNCGRPLGKQYLRGEKGRKVQLIERIWLRGVDWNHRPLGYESKTISNFNNLQDAGGYLKAL